MLFYMFKFKNDMSVEVTVSEMKGEYYDIKRRIISLR